MSEVRQRYTNVCAQLGEIIYKIHREEKVLETALMAQSKRAEARDALLAQLRDLEVEFITMEKLKAAESEAAKVKKADVVAPKDGGDGKSKKSSI
jgi:Holliday junction resolvasome RuvABC endonuclease subunit